MGRRKFLTTGSCIRWWRSARKLSLEQLAAKAGLSKSALCRIELDEQEARADELKRLARALAVAVTEFFGDSTTAEKRAS